MEAINISVKQLSPSSVSRTRAQKAFENLQLYLSGGKVEIDLNDEDLISISFLDELVLRLTESRQLDKVLFLATDPSVQQRLAHVAELRNAIIHFRNSKDEPAKIVQPKRPPTFELKKRKSG